MSETMPPFLYKYRPFNEYTSQCITEQELYFSSARSFNDPFDCSPILSYDCTQEEFDEYSYRILNRIAPDLSTQQKRQLIQDRPRDPNSAEVRQQLKQSFETTLNSVGIFCLSEVSQSTLMWSHYADSHSGICLKFEVSEEIGFFSQAHKVIYQSNRPVCNFVNDERDEMSRQALLVKADSWSYEKEWRMIGLERPPGIHRYPPELLKGIILGANISDENTELVRSWVSSLDFNVELQKAQVNDEQFQLDILDIVI